MAMVKQSQFNDSVRGTPNIYHYNDNWQVLK